MSPPDALRRVTYAQLAVAWGVSLRTVKRWIAEDQARGYRIRLAIHSVNAARRYIVIRLVDADAVLARHSRVNKNRP